MPNQTKFPKKSQIQRKWYLIDAKDKILGHLAVTVANLLRGKNKPYFHPAVDVGDYVVVINASAFSVTGKKLEEKVYYHYTGYPGGLRKKTLKEVLKEKPTTALREAVSGMLPKNKLKKNWLKRLYIYKGEEHPLKEKLETIDA